MIIDIISISCYYNGVPRERDGEKQHFRKDEVENMRLEKVITSKGIRKVVEFKQLEEVWTDENSGSHYLYRCKLENGATVVVFPMNYNNTSKYIPVAFKGVNYDGKEQTANGKYSIQIDLSDITFTREMQVVFLTGQLVWTKKQNKLIAKNASLQALKKYINLTDGVCTITNSKYPNSEYVCTRDTYDRVELKMYIG